MSYKQMILEKKEEVSSLGCTTSQLCNNKLPKRVLESSCKEFSQSSLRRNLKGVFSKDVGAWKHLEVRGVPTRCLRWCSEGASESRNVLICKQPSLRVPYSCLL